MKKSNTISKITYDKQKDLLKFCLNRVVDCEMGYDGILIFNPGQIHLLNIDILNMRSIIMIWENKGKYSEQI